MMPSSNVVFGAPCWPAQVRSDDTDCLSMDNPPSPTPYETVNVSRDVMRSFRKAVLLRHAKLYGALGQEASEALRLHAERLLLEAGA